MREETIKASFAGFLSGRGYCARVDFTVPGTETIVDVAAALPRMRDLKTRLKRGFVPTGILQHLIGADWMGIEEIIRRTGYEGGFVASVMAEAVGNNWVEKESRHGMPYFRILDYRVPARECVLAFVGTENLRGKIIRLKELVGCYSRALFIFPYALDNDTMEQIVDLGAGIIRYYRDYGVFQETVPAETNDIEDMRRFALIVEYVTYNNVWIMTGETI